MIREMIIWSAAFLILLMIQYFICEKYILIKKGYEWPGHMLSILIELCCIALSCYLIVFDDNLNFLGFAFLLVTFYSSFRFINRSHERKKG